LVHDSSKEATELARKGPKFPWGPKLEALMVHRLSIKSNDVRRFVNDSSRAPYSFPPTSITHARTAMSQWAIEHREFRLRGWLSTTQAYAVTNTYRRFGRCTVLNRSRWQDLRDEFKNRSHRRHGSLVCKFHHTAPETGRLRYVTATSHARHFALSGMNCHCRRQDTTTRCIRSRKRAFD
jgi:hypothetical protein